MEAHCGLQAPAHAQFSPTMMIMANCQENVAHLQTLSQNGDRLNRCISDEFFLRVKGFRLQRDRSSDSVVGNR